MCGEMGSWNVGIPEGRGDTVKQQNRDEKTTMCNNMHATKADIYRSSMLRSHPLCCLNLRCPWRSLQTQIRNSTVCLCH